MSPLRRNVDRSRAEAVTALQLAHLLRPEASAHTSIDGMHGVEGRRPTVHIAVDDVDERYRALRTSANVVVKPETTHWGTRWFVVRDPDGNLLAYEQRTPD